MCLKENPRRSKWLEDHFRPSPEPELTEKQLKELKVNSRDLGYWFKTAKTGTWHFATNHNPSCLCGKHNYVKEGTALSMTEPHETNSLCRRKLTTLITRIEAKRIGDKKDELRKIQEQKLTVGVSWIVKGGMLMNRLIAITEMHPEDSGLVEELEKFFKQS